jgi:transcriptional regulator with XRE-family HTH domain
MKTVGQIIKEKRKARRWTQKRLAEKVDCMPSTIACWETNRAYPNALFLMSLADAFDCTIDELCGRVK